MVRNKKEGKRTALIHGRNLHVEISLIRPCDVISSDIKKDGALITQE